MFQNPVFNHAKHSNFTPFPDKHRTAKTVYGRQILGIKSLIQVWTVENEGYPKPTTVTVFIVIPHLQTGPTEGIINTARASGTSRCPTFEQVVQMLSNSSRQPPPGALFYDKREALNCPRVFCNVMFALATSLRLPSA